MNKRPLLITAASLALSATVPAHAVSTASASLGPITITLFDLNPLDNIAPQVTFSNYYGYGSYVDAYAYDTANGNYQGNSAWGTGPFEPVSVSVMTLMSGATSSVTGPGVATGTTLSASGYANGTTNTTPFGYQYSSFGATAFAPYYYSDFTLSTGTLMLISATGSASAGVTNSFDPATSWGYEYAYAYAQVVVSGPSAGGGGSQSASDAVGFGVSSAYVPDNSCVYGYCYGPASGSDSRALAVSFANVSGGDLTGNVQMYASANGYSYAQAVPEPETYAMMLGGLMMLGFMARRRQA